MAVPAWTPLPAPPNRLSGDAEFSEQADNFLGAFSQLQIDMHNLAQHADNMAAAAEERRSVAAASASAAAASAAAATTNGAAQVTLAAGQATVAGNRASAAAESASQAEQFRDDAEMFAGAAGAAIGAGTLAGNANKMLSVNPTGEGVLWRFVGWNDITGKPATYPPSTHTHPYLPLAGGTMTGAIVYGAHGGANGLKSGNGDSCTDTVNNLAITSWHGIGFSPAATGQPVPAGQYSHWFNTRTGDMGMRGSFSTIGSIYAFGNVTAYSDVRLKTNIELIPDALDKICQLRGVTYDRRDIDGIGRQTGVIAQEVQAVLPEAVMQADDEQGTLSVAYGNLVGLLVEAVKELRAEVRELRARVEG